MEQLGTLVNRRISVPVAAHVPQIHHSWCGRLAKLCMSVDNGQAGCKLKMEATKCGLHRPTDLKLGQNREKSLPFCSSTLPPDIQLHVLSTSRIWKFDFLITTNKINFLDLFVDNKNEQVQSTDEQTTGNELSGNTKEKRDTELSRKKVLKEGCRLT